MWNVPLASWWPAVVMDSSKEGQLLFDQNQFHIIGVQRRMADWSFEKAQTWEDLLAAHDKWMRDYNFQKHMAHEERQDGCHSPAEVLGWKSGCSCCECSLSLNFQHLEGISLPRELAHCNSARTAIASPSSAVLDLVALPQPPEASPTGYQVTPAIYALVPRLPQPPETNPAAVDQSA